MPAGFWLAGARIIACWTTKKKKKNDVILPEIFRETQPAMFATNYFQAHVSFFPTWKLDRVGGY